MKKLHVVYIRPSRYDDEGYVIRFWRGVLPSNTLCCLESLTRSVAENGELGPDVNIMVDVFDDTVQSIPIRRIARLNRRPDTTVVVGFTGVQSNQFMRASDLALEFRKLGVQVMIGGFHVSGMLAMFDEPSYELQRLLDRGVTLVKGEVEAPGVMTALLRDALHETMRPVYTITEFPDLSHAPVPRASRKLQSRFATRNMATIDTSRGCPFNCSFCTIINVQGRKMRYRSAASVLQAIRENYARGISVYFFTDDNFSRNPAWEEILDGLIALREQDMNIMFMVQTDTQAHRIPNFVEKAAKAGCYLAFIGMESINPKNLEAVGKKQNRTSEYEWMVEKWHQHGIQTHVGYIIGLPFDTRESVRMDLERLRNQVKVDIASLFMLVPLPGSRDHQEMVRACKPVDADYNNFDGLHETFKHPQMPPGEWRAAYDDAMHIFYSKENIINALLRCSRSHYWHLFWSYGWYRYSTVEGIHPMATGLFRLKERRARRPGFPRENVFQYAWRRIKDTTHGLRVYANLFFEFQEIWMLTRRTEDPRWATLAELRAKWAEVQQHIAEYDMRGRCDEAAQELKTMLASTAEHLAQLSHAGGHMSASVRRKLQKKANEAEAYLRSFDMQLPGWRRIAEGERYITQSLLSGYEDIAISYVAKRRQFNEYRRDFFDRLKTGRILGLNVSQIPFAIVYECLFASRLFIHYYSHR